MTAVTNRDTSIPFMCSLPFLTISPRRNTVLCLSESSIPLVYADNKMAAVCQLKTAIVQSAVRSHQGGYRKLLEWQSLQLPTGVSEAAAAILEVAEEGGPSIGSRRISGALDCVCRQ